MALLIFQAGMFVGFKKAGFSYRVGEQYFRQMNGRPNDQFMGMNRGDFENSHGAIGKIISISLPSVIISDKDNTEKTILISSSTDIRKFKDSIKPEDLKINDFVTVIGNPNDKAEIEARLVRIMPDPANMQGGFIGTTTIK
ncbi:hypothetical protein [Candidatus Magnetominusculus dajiuhuensis]|uniref:hypothetical protein n=1 Tax=Candidatus Magnetominusculus dajiuhuensis TaxID=3137712 RepID=UPI003B42B293